MPGGYGTDESLPWGSSGDTGYVAPASTGTPNFGGQGTGGANQPPIVDPPIVDRNIIQEGIGSLGGALHGDEIYQPEIRNNYDVLDAFTDLSKIHGQTYYTDADQTPAGMPIPTKYGKSWDFNPNNPDNLIGMDTHTLGSMIAVDSSGKPILDSGGKPVFTSFGKHLYDHMHDEGFIGQNQSVGDPSALQDYVDTFSFDELHDLERDYFDQNWYGMDDFDYNFYGGVGPPRTDTGMQDLGIWGATPLSEIESVGFDQFVPQYEKEFTEERIASPLHVKGMTPAGFEYLGSPEFGTRFYEV